MSRHIILKEMSQILENSLDFSQTIIFHYFPDLLTLTKIKGKNSGTRLIHMPRFEN